MADLNKELAAVIDQHVPAQLGEQLRKRLDEAAKLDRTNADLLKRIEELTGERDKARADLGKHRDLDNREGELAARVIIINRDRDELTTRENALERTLAEQRSSAAERERDSIFKLAEIALGKRSRSETIERNSGRDVMNPGNYSTRLHNDETITHKVEETG